MRNWDKNNLDKVRESKRKWAKKDYLEHPEKYRAKDLKRYTDDPEKERKRSMGWYSANRDRALARMRKWRQKSSEKRRTYRNQYNKKYRQTPKYKFEHALRARIITAIKNQSKGLSRKCGKTVSLLGCSIKDFRIYLESKFEPGMSWNNFGSVWHMDHIMPCSIFDLSKSAHQHRCFHFSNIRPCFIEENLKKGSKLITNQFNLL